MEAVADDEEPLVRNLKKGSKTLSDSETESEPMLRRSQRLRKRKMRNSDDENSSPGSCLGKSISKTTPKMTQQFSDSESENELLIKRRKRTKSKIIDSEEDELGSPGSSLEKSKRKRRPKMTQQKMDKEKQFEMLKACRKSNKKLVFDSETDESSSDESGENDEILSEDSDDFQDDAIDIENNKCKSSSDDSESASEASYDPQDYKSQMAEITKNLSRSSQADQIRKNQYLNALFKPQKPSKSPSKKKKEKADPKHYHRLIQGLKPLATNDKLTDDDIVKQFVCVEYDQDYGRSEKCICGKNNLFHLYYMKNKIKAQKIENGDEELLDYAMSTFIVGSKCIQSFYKSSHLNKPHLQGAKCVESEFIKWAKNGVNGCFRSQKNNIWTISVASKIIVQDWSGFQMEYAGAIERSKNDAINIKVYVTDKTLKKIGKKYVYWKGPNRQIQADSRHRFYINYKLENGQDVEPGKPLKIKFYLHDMRAPKSDQSRSSEPTKGKHYIL